MANSGFSGFLKRFEVNRAVSYGIQTKIFQLASTPVTTLLIAAYFTPEIQGYYYTFGSLLALQVFVELGLGTVIIQFASHEWSRLALDDSGRIVGDPSALSRLRSIASVAFKWYLSGAGIATIGLGLGGFFFFQESATTISWLYPWIALCCLTGITLCLVPIWSLLEGCNQVANVYFYRFLEVLFRTVPLWLVILAGADLWVPAVSSAMGLLWAFLFLRRYYWDFLRQLLLIKPGEEKVAWKTEILPMQWRIAVSWLCGYFVFSMFTPVLFHYHGAVIAGQMGMTWSLVSIVSSVSGTWIQPRAPYFGILIAQKKYGQLDRLFSRLLGVTLAVAVTIAFAIWVVVYSLYRFDISLAHRLLPPFPTTFFLIGTVVMMLGFPFSVYLRAHKKEPLMMVSVLGAVLMCMSNIVLGKSFGATGMAAGYLSVNVFTCPLVIYIWFTLRRKWHGEKLQFNFG